MKQVVKLIIKYILYGISMGCTFFVISCLFLFIVGGEDLLMLIFKDFARQAIGAIVVGIACGGTSVIYQFNLCSVFMKSIIHFFIGAGVFYLVAIYLGWIPFYSVKTIFTIVYFLFPCVIFVVIWFCFYIFNRNEAKMINERLRKIEQNNDINK